MAKTSERSSGSRSFTCDTRKTRFAADEKVVVGEKRQVNPNWRSSWAVPTSPRRLTLQMSSQLMMLTLDEWPLETVQNWLNGTEIPPDPSFAAAIRRMHLLTGHRHSANSRIDAEQLYMVL